MILTLQTQLLPSPEHAKKLLATIERFNEAADWLAEKAFEERSANKVSLQQEYYDDLREKFGLSSQMAMRCIAVVCGADSRDKPIQPRFRPHAAVPYDRRLMSFKGLDRVSLLTLEGRVIVLMMMGQDQRDRFNATHGECDLVYRKKDHKWFLLVTVDVPGQPVNDPHGFIGVDLGVINIATDSDGDIHTNTETEKVRKKRQKVKHSLQRKSHQQAAHGKRPKNVRRKLKSLSKKERDFKANTNQTIAQRIVEKATETPFSAVFCAMT